MCGIAGVFLRDPSLKVDLDGILDTMLDEIDHRGGDATGYVAIGDGGMLEWQKAACDVVDFCKYRRPVPRGTRVLLAHTRWATQGLPAFTENNHPLRRGAFFAIHNGHVDNDLEMLRACGKQRIGQVDSEAIVASLAKTGSLGQLPLVMEQIEGAAAVAVVDEREPDKLSLARGFSSPMFVLETRKLVLFGSTKATVLNAYRRHIGTIADERVVELEPGTCLHFEGTKKYEVGFTPYAPPVVTHYPSGTPIGKTGATSRFSAWDEDYTDCDDCGVWQDWKTITYRADPTTGLTVGRCRECDYFEGIEDDEFDEDAVSADMSDVNRAILKQFLHN